MSAITTSALDTPARRSVERTCDDLAVFVLAAITLIAGLTFRDYGVGWDDDTHADYPDLLRAHVHEPEGRAVCRLDGDPDAGARAPRRGISPALAANDPDRRPRRRALDRLPNSRRAGAGLRDGRIRAVADRGVPHARGA